MSQTYSYGLNFAASQSQKTKCFIYHAQEDADSEDDTDSVTIKVSDGKCQQTKSFGITIIDNDEGSESQQQTFSCMNLFDGEADGNPSNDPGYFTINFDGSGSYLTDIDTSGGTGSDSDDSHDDTTCFLAGTRITMADMSTKNIEDIRIGDRVKAVNQDLKCIVDAVVADVNTHGREQSGEYYLRVIVSPEKNSNYQMAISVTPDHPMFIIKDEVSSDKSYQEVTADQIRPGNYLLTISLDKLYVQEIQKVPLKESTYNIIVDKYHNYFADGILVGDKINSDSLNSDSGNDEDQSSDSPSERESLIRRLATITLNDEDGLFAKIIELFQRIMTFFENIQSRISDTSDNSESEEPEEPEGLPDLPPAPLGTLSDEVKTGDGADSGSDSCLTSWDEFDLKYLWDYGDGTLDLGIKPTHTFSLNPEMPPEDDNPDDEQKPSDDSGDDSGLGEGPIRLSYDEVFLTPRFSMYTVTLYIIEDVNDVLDENTLASARSAVELIAAQNLHDHVLSSDTVEITVENPNAEGLPIEDVILASGLNIENSRDGISRLIF
jgi:hypothetical protein